jgi:hypothetical protein
MSRFQLKNKAINTTEGLINDKANKFVNQFGSGRSEISIHKIESENPTYSIKTIQPLSKLDSDSRYNLESCSSCRYKAY